MMAQESLNSSKKQQKLEMCNIFVEVGALYKAEFSNYSYGTDIFWFTANSVPEIFIIPHGTIMVLEHNGINNT
jgi:hypothetical protein